LPAPERCERLRFVGDTPSHAGEKHISEPMFVQPLNIVK
jgi:hypothetical protein